MSQFEKLKKEKNITYTPNSIRRTDFIFFSPQTQQLDPEELTNSNLLSVRKPTVGRTHSLPNDSYMFLPPQVVGPKDQAQSVTQSQGPQHIESSHRNQSGTDIRHYQLQLISQVCVENAIKMS